MRPELNLIELIERYLGREMTDEQVTAFEQEMQSDPELKMEVDLQKEILAGIENLEIKKSIDKTFKTHKIIKLTKTISIFTIAIATAAALTYFIGNFDRTISLPNVNEKGERQWADADKYLPAQNFELISGQDTVIETNGGIVIAVPKDAFLDEKGDVYEGPIDFEVKEALEPFDIIKAGLSTKSGDKPLETAGMFYLNAKSNGKTLPVNPDANIKVEVPTNKFEPGMQLFEGKRLSDGSIDWINPQPLDNSLNPVDIHSLNFYPNGYQKSLFSLGLNGDNKTYADSLLYTFTCSIGEEEPPVNAAKLFKYNCRACHRSDSKKLVGPGLGGIIHKRDLDWLVAFIQNSKALIESGDQQAIDVFREFNSIVMPPQPLSKEEIIAVLNYLDWETRVIATGDKVTWDTIAETNSTTVAESTSAECRGIDPSQIKAIWNDRFQNTNIATREFEERLQVIYASCNKNILDLYTNNLDLPLYQIDSMVLTSSERDLSVGNKFHKFYLRKDGRVKIDDALAKKLGEYYDLKSKIYAEAIAETNRKFWEKQSRLDQSADKMEMGNQSSNALRITENYKKEFEMNMDEAYRQLGKKRPKPIPPSTYKVRITSLGWNNIDRYAGEATANRTTLDYTDRDGEKVLIEYKELTIDVENEDQFDRTYVYLAAHEQYSYIKMKQQENTFKEKLNKLVNYNVLCIGYKGEQAFFSSIENTKPGTASVSPEMISDEELEIQIRKLCRNRARQDLQADLAFEKFQIKEIARQKKNAEIADLRKTLFPVIFPCESIPVQSESFSMN
ncbi:MAG: cytochrome c [Bacteroidetes bacterium]|nr:cytochrome c [Bacteroidota bacterium]